MPDPDKIIAIVRKAIAGVRATTGRSGRLIRLGDAEDVFVAGDLHGNVGHFQAILKRADLPGHPRRHLVVQELIHGPFQYPDGSDKSHQLLDLIAALTCQYPGRIHFLPGNHELAQRTARPVARAAGELNTLFRAGVEFAYGSRADLVYGAYLDFIRIAPLAVLTENRVFLSHSIPPMAALAHWDPAALEADELPPEQDQPGGAVYHLVWGRDVAAATAEAFLKKVDADLLVTGHLPCEQGFQVPNDRQLVLDSQEVPAGFCLFPADRPLTHAELVACAGTL